MSEVKTQENNLNWPPPYSIRNSKRAKRLSLKVSYHKGLEVVVPKSCKNINVENFLLEHKTWILKHIPTIAKAKPNIPIELPTVFELRSIAETWNIKYFTLNKDSLTTINPIHTLIVTRNVTKLATEKVKKLFAKWLTEKAKFYLENKLLELSVLYNFTVNNISVRGQKTLWGSCDSKKNISLNYKLIFLPEELTTHVILHELCHTKYLNHGKNFWELLQSLDSNCNSNRKKLHDADQFIPSFINF